MEFTAIGHSVETLFPPTEPESPILRAGSFFTALIEEVTYFSPESGQCVLEVRPVEGAATLLVAGALADAHPGLLVEVTLLPGAVVSPYAARLKLGGPDSARGLKKFLKSGALAGLTPAIATAISKTVRADLFFALMDREPARLLEVPGVGPKRAAQIARAWGAFRAARDFREFLFGQDLPLAWADRLTAARGSGARTLFEEAPYLMAREEGLEFDRVDAYALRHGAALAAPARLSAGLVDALRLHYQDGQCAFPEEKLLDEGVRRLGVARGAVAEALEIELLNETLVADEVGGTPCVFLRKTWELEKAVAERLCEFRGRKAPWGEFHLRKVIHWAQSILAIELAPLQVTAIETALSSALTLITGGPGTGKTTLIRSLTAILQTQHLRFALCSPTGRAAKRLGEATGHAAQTIHRLLKYDGVTGKFGCRRDRQLELDLLLIDEASMVDLALMGHLLDALPERCALICVGDADQIPPVGAGNVFQSMLESGGFTTVKLTRVFRQGEESLIRINADRINAGRMPIADAGGGVGDFRYLPARTVAETKRIVFDLVHREIPERLGIHDPAQVQILVPQNKGPLGTKLLNEELARLAGGTRDRLVGFEQSFREGDKVMVGKNDYARGVYNGDIGFITRISRAERFVQLDVDGREVRFGFHELANLALAYAITVHKAQGSEYRAVIVIIAEEHLPLAQRHLVYTAVTRGKEHVFLVADPVALATAIASDENNRRWQKLTERLRAAGPRPAE